MKYMIETIGCQMNICESEALSKIFLDKGLTQVKDTSEADLLILNTCSVRAQAEQKAFSFLGRAEELKDEKKSLKIVVIGCMAQRIKEKIKKRFKSVDLVAGTDIETDKLADKILSFFPDYSNLNLDILPDVSLGNSGISRFITIMKGCGNYCSYCVVPFVRGPERSIDDALILDECAKMAESGAKEIIFLGQNVNSYNYKGLNFSGLIKKAAQIPDILRIRCMTNHPKDLSDELIETMALEPKVCKHIHLPMQSASDKILERMNRKYTYSHYLKLIEKLRKNIDGISITTDIIVGFPGEQEEDFKQTLKAVKDIRFGGLYVFRYSPRPNTKAAELIDDIPIEEKQRRLAVILKESNDISAEIVSQMTGTVQEVLFEKYENGNLEARTGGGRKVFVKGGKQYLGKKIAVLIKEAKINSLFGEIL